MTIQWSYAALCAACGLVGILIVAGIRHFKQRRPVLSFPISFAVFLTCTAAPSIPVFIAYPFVSPKPNLSNHEVYLVVAAFGIIWVIYQTIKQTTEQ